MSKAAVIIAAAGSSTRMGGGVKKQFLMCEGLPVLVRTVKAFCRVRGICAVVVAAPADDLPFTSQLLEKYGVKDVILAAGGPTRQVSVMNALAKVPGEAELVLVHDGARPFVSEKVIDGVLSALEDGAQAAVPGVRPKNTIRTAEKTLDRSLLYEVQTPQGFRKEVLERALKEAESSGFTGTDDAGLVERLGIPVAVTQGEYTNIKITTPEDLPKMMRIGTGYDVHRLVSGRKLMLGCVEVPYEKGLLGHSDADVIAHAIADALLGAAALGDIGKLFPDSSPDTEGMSGEAILSRTAEFLRENGFTISNVDATLVAEKPKISPYTDRMREAVAKALGLDPSLVSIKATTEEKLGFTGDGTAMSAQAAAMIKEI